MPFRNLPSICFPVSLSENGLKRRMARLVLPLVVMLFAASGMMAQTTLNLSPCTNCSSDTTCLPKVYNQGIAQFDFSGVSTNNAAPTQVTGSAFNFTLGKKSVVQFSYGSTTSQTGGSGAEAGQITFQLRLDGTAIQNASHDAHGNNTATTASYNYDVDFNEWRTLDAGSYTVDLAAWRAANLTSGFLGGANLQVAVFPECGFDGGGSTSSTTDTLYIAGDTCVAARAFSAASQTFTGTSTKVDFTGETYDIGGIFDPATDQFTIAEDGLYAINASINVELDGENEFYRFDLYVNGGIRVVETEICGRNAVSGVVSNLTTTQMLSAGDVVHLEVFVGGGAVNAPLGGAASTNYFELYRVDCGTGASAGDGTSTTDTLYIAGDTCVAFSAQGTAQSIAVGVQTTLIAGTEDFDTGNGYNPATGIYTAPQTGTYIINANIRTGVASGFPSFSRSVLKVNGGTVAVVKHTFSVSGENNDEKSLSIIVDLNAGDEVTVAATNTGTFSTSEATVIHFGASRMDCGAGATGGAGTPQTLSATDTTLTLSNGGGTVSTFPKFLYSARAVGPVATLAEPGPTVMNLDTEEFDVSPASNMVDLAANTITIRKSGYYRVDLGTLIDRSFGANLNDIIHYVIRLYANATNILVDNPELHEVKNTAGDFVQEHVAKVVYLNAGDILRVEIDGVTGFSHATNQPRAGVQLGVTFLGE